MEYWQNSLMTTLQSISSEGELFSAIEKEAQRLGFEHCAYGFRMPWPLTNPRTVLYNNYPENWKNRYIEQHYLEIDPTVHHGTTSLLPLIWADIIFKEAPNFWEDAQSFGLRHGWAQSTLNMNGSLGMLSLARSGEPLTELEIRSHSYQMAQLTQAAHLCMSHLISKRLLLKCDTNLTTREKEVLRWTAEGKTSGEISTILSISERTANFHITNAIAKLNCANKTAAAAKATLLGLLRKH